jgi:putative redox protein
MSSFKGSALRWTGSGNCFQGQVGLGPIATLDGGREEGPSPMDSVLLGLMGCMGIDVLMVLQKSRVPFESLEILADAERASEIPRFFKRVNLSFAVGGMSEKDNPKLARAVELSVHKYCSVLHSLRPDMELITEIKSS